MPVHHGRVRDDMPTAITTEFAYAELKLAEARFFLSRLRRAKANVFLARCYLSAFLSSARSVTFALQAALRHRQGFEDWYAEHGDVLRRNPVARAMKTRRDTAIHRGEPHIEGGSIRKDERGRIVVRHWFASGDDVVDHCSAYLALLEQLVSDWRDRFPSERDALFDVDELERRRLTVDDVEEMLGYPRGWTEAPGLSASDRLQLLRDHG